MVCWALSMSITLSVLHTDMEHCLSGTLTVWHSVGHVVWHSVFLSLCHLHLSLSLCLTLSLSLSLYLYLYLYLYLSLSLSLLVSTFGFGNRWNEEPSREMGSFAVVSSLRRYSLIKDRRKNELKRERTALLRCWWSKLRFELVEEDGLEQLEVFQLEGRF